MPESKYPDATVQRAITLMATYKNVSKVARLMELPRTVVSSWVNGSRRQGSSTPNGERAAVPAVPASGDAGDTPDPADARTKKLVEKWDKTTMASLDIVSRRLDLLSEKVERGEKVTQDDVRGLKDVTWSAAVGTDKLAVLSGNPTQRTEHSMRVSLIAPDILKRSTLRVIERDRDGTVRTTGDESLSLAVTIPDQTDDVIEGEATALPDAGAKSAGGQEA